MRTNQTLVLLPVEVNEALRSITARIAAMTTTSRRDLAQSCLGARWAEIDWVLPTNLRSFTEQVGARIGLPSVDYWLRAHTLAPFYSSTLTDSKSSAMAARLNHPVPGRRHPLVAFSVEEWLAPTARLCLACDERAQGDVGFSWVKRSWLLPFVTRCPEHGEILHAYPGWSPRSRGPDRKRTVLQGREKAGLELSSLSQNFLESGQSVLPELARLLASKGYRHKSGKVRRRTLVEMVSRYVDGRIEHPELSWLLTSPSKLGRLLAPIWSPDKVALHPSVAIYLLNALRDQPEVCPQLHLDLEEKQLHRQQKYEAFVAALGASTSVTQAAKAVGLSVTTAVTAAISLGATVRLRPKVLTAARRIEVESLLAAGYAPAQAAAQTKLSLSTVYRVAKTSPAVSDERLQKRRQQALDERKTVWSTLMVQNPGATTSELRRIAPSVYAYLYRNARTWLQEMCPSRQKVPAIGASAGRLPAAADELLAAAIRRAAEVRGKDKATATRLLAEASKRSSSLANVQAPLAKAALGEVAESSSDFVTRRLAVAADQVLAEGHAAAPWRVIRKSGLRASTVTKSQVSAADVAGSRCAFKSHEEANGQ